MSLLSSSVRDCMIHAPEETSPGVWETSFIFAADFCGFDGHFPGDPMLPGVAQIMASAYTASGERAMRIKQIGRTKFMNMVRPGDSLHVRAKVTPVNDGVAVIADCSINGEPCAQVKLVLGLR